MGGASRPRRLRTGKPSPSPSLSPRLSASPSKSSRTPGNGRVTRCKEPESPHDCVEQSSHHLPWALSVPLRFGGCLSQKLGYSDLIYPLMESP